MPSPTIVFAMLNESGHLNPTYKLSKELAARGYDVRYLAIEDVRAQIEAQGLRVEPLFPDLFPAGMLAHDERLKTLARRRAITDRYQAQLDRLLTRAPLAESRPALLLVDVTQTQLALWARRARVPFAYINTSLPQTKDPGVPPLRSGLPYGENAAGRARSELAWRTFLAQRRASARAANVVRMCPPYELARTQAGRFGVSASELDAETVYMPQLRAVPELVLCPEAFDFPRPARAERTHVESIDLERRELTFDWDVIPEHKPLVYCSLGGQRYRSDATPRFFARLLHAVAARPALHLLLSVGKHVDPSVLAAPANVTVVRAAPQLAVLRRARAMITHGGLGSVKECSLFGVPMLVFPLDVDQPGNAARVVHHGLGLRGDVDETSADELGALLDRVLAEPSFRARGALLSQRFQELESTRPGVSVVERLLRARAPGAV